MIGSRLPGLAGPLSRLVPTRAAGAAFVLSGGVFVASPAAITPTLSGVELVSNGNMEAGDPPTGWNLPGVAGTLSQVVDERTGGSGSHAANMARIVSNPNITQDLITVAGTWLQLSSWRKSLAGSAVSVILYDSAYITAPLYTTAATWVNVISSGRALSATTAVWAYDATGSGTESVRFDDISVQAINLPSTLGTPYDLGADGDFKVTLTALTAGTQAGQCFCLDNPRNPRNFGLLYHDGTNLNAVKCLNGVYTNLFTPVAAAYGATKPLWLSKRGPTITAYYGGVKIGSGAIVEDAIRNNTIVAPFSTYSGNTFANLDLQAA